MTVYTIQKRGNEPAVLEWVVEVEGTNLIPGSMLLYVYVANGASSRRKSRFVNTLEQTRAKRIVKLTYITGLPYRSVP